MSATSTALVRSGHTARILVVEDDEGVRESLMLLLQSEGYDVVGVENGQEALQALRADDGSIRLILLDLMMPVMNGTAFRDEQRRDPRLTGVPVAILSATVDPTEEIQRLGAVAAFRKPVLDMTRLLGLVAEHCPKKRR